MRRGLFATLLILLAIAQPAAATTAEGQRSAQLGDFTTARIIADVPYARIDNAVLKMDILVPRDDHARHPAVLFIHGGGWHAGSKKFLLAHPRVAALADQGYVVVSVDYRLSGAARWPAQLDDVKAAVRFLRAHADDYAIDADRIIAWGKSAGAHLALMLGTTGDVTAMTGSVGDDRAQPSNVAGVISFLGPTDLPAFVEQCREIGCQATGPKSIFTRLLGCDMGTGSACLDLAAAASPVTYVSAGDPPAFLIDGDEDTIVPYLQGVELYGRLKHVGVKSHLSIIPGGKHMDQPTWDASWETMRGWLAELGGEKRGQGAHPTATTPDAQN